MIERPNKIVLNILPSFGRLILSCISSQIIFLAITFTFNISLRAEPLENPWRMVRQTDDVWVWKLEGTRDVIGTFQTKRRTSNINWENVKSKSFFEKLTQEKQKMLSMIGISHWTVTNSRWVKKKDHYELQLRGSYQNAQNKEIRFHEIHLFYEDKTHQILMAYPSTRSMTRSIASQFTSMAKNRISQ